MQINGCNKKKNIHRKDLDNTDIISWIENFKEIVEISQWHDLTAMQILKSAMDRQYADKINIFKFLQSALNHILKLKFTDAYLISLTSEIQQSKQNDYYLINEYYEKIKYIQTQIGIAKGNKKEVIDQNINESFYNGLETSIALDLIQANIENATDATNFIQKKKQNY